jgi:CubicO group peptidase (beta-lactamase class C family)
MSIMNTRTLSKLVALAAFCFALDCGAASKMAEALDPFIKSGKLPGAVSILYSNGELDVTCAGYADVSTGRSITADDAFMQCSQTKGFCGVTVAKLIEEGKLDLDDPVSKYLPEFSTLWVKASESGDQIVLNKAKNALTIRMCLNHTGGFPFEISAKQDRIPGGGWSGGAPIRIVAAIAAASPLLFEPGTSARYSNTGIDIAAAVVEVVTGMKWQDYLRREVLDPLEMKNTWFWPTDEQLKTKIEMYDCHADAPATWKLQNNWQQRPYNDSHVFASAGAGLWTTANDQYKFYKMLMNLGVGDNGVRILKEETVKTLLAVSSRPSGFEGYSLGLYAPEQSKDGEDAWFGHGGAFGTNCMVNWRKKQIKLWVVQLSGYPRPWDAAAKDAAEEFFKSTIDTKAADAYTNRTE